MLSKAICEISALNKKAVGVPDSSKLIPRAKSCTLRGQELVCWRSQLEQAQAPARFTIKLISLTTIFYKCFTQTVRGCREHLWTQYYHEGKKSSCRSQHQNVWQRPRFPGLALRNTAVSHNTLRLRLPDAAAQLKKCTNQPTNVKFLNPPLATGWFRLSKASILLKIICALVAWAGKLWKWTEKFLLSGAAPPWPHVACVWHTFIFLVTQGYLWHTRDMYLYEYFAKNYKKKKKPMREAPKCSLRDVS